MTGQAAFYDFRRPGIFNRGRAQAVKTENGLIVAVVNREEGFRRAQIVALAGVTAQEFIQRVLSAVERIAIMFLADRLFVPSRHDYVRFGNARAAASSFAFGAGGFSSRSRTLKLSLPESCT